ncbi:DUF3037 domain-containing protein [Fimbriiglobus ruber]|uniref:DUF3037 domain-containing protein n=1 Tax=Fimbriiglobus ruber TaxID=1908690 RepID=A0A225DXR6_9BACT|nr:DUF3037 domain-containing protein [Fimbriiglobus ruber]OWK45743.1 hypothetical protein FRUB_02074 [Fimbriiglobus ruber]
MPRKRAFYSVVQYMPDGSRSEAANAGIVVFVPETRRIAVRTSSTLARIKKFFTTKKRDLRRIELSLEAFKNRLETAQGEFGSEDEFRRFVAARADDVRMTPPRLVVLEDAARTCDELYADLVGDETADEPRPTEKSFFPPPVAAIFGRLEAARKVWRPGTIVVPESKQSLEIPLAYKNGKVNYVLPQSLAPGRRPEARLPKLGFDGLLIHQHKINDEEGKLVVLSTDERASGELERRFADVLQDFHVRFVPYAASLEFAEEVAETAH